MRALLKIKFERDRLLLAVSWIALESWCLVFLEYLCRGFIQGLGVGGPGRVYRRHHARGEKS